MILTLSPIHMPGFIAAFAMAFTGASMIGRLVLLDPQLQTWPDAPRWLRNLMYARMVVFVYAATAMLFNESIQVRVSSQALAWVLIVNALVEVALLVHLLRQRHSKSVWSKIKLAMHLAPQMDALVPEQGQVQIYALGEEHEITRRRWGDVRRHR